MMCCGKITGDNRDALRAEHDVLVHPMDKTDNYIKRCVAVPGDVLQIKDGLLYINNKQAFVPPGIAKRIHCRNQRHTDLRRNFWKMNLIFTLLLKPILNPAGNTRMKKMGITMNYRVANTCLP